MLDETVSHLDALCHTIQPHNVTKLQIFSNKIIMMQVVTHACCLFRMYNSKLSVQDSFQHCSYISLTITLFNNVSAPKLISVSFSIHVNLDSIDYFLCSRIIYAYKI